MMTIETRNTEANLIFPGDTFLSGEHGMCANRVRRNDGTSGDAPVRDLHSGVRISSRTGVRISGRAGVRISSAKQGVRISSRSGVRISGHEGVRISSRSGVRISGCARGVRISGSHESPSASAPFSGRGGERHPGKAAGTAPWRGARHGLRSSAATSENRHSV